MNYYPRFPSDYIAKTLHLSMLEDGAYTRLLDWCYANEKAVPHAQRYAITRASTTNEKRAVDTVLMSFFEHEHDAWINARVEREIAAAKPKIEAARANGKLGGRPKKTQVEEPAGLSDQNPMGSENETQQKPTGKPTGLTPQNQNHKSKSKDQKPCAAGAARFPEFWTVYPRHEARKQALEIWQRKRLDERADALIADVERRKREHRPWREGFVPHAVVYLRNERWDDAIDASAQADSADAPGYMAGAL